MKKLVTRVTLAVSLFLSFGLTFCGISNFQNLAGAATVSGAKPGAKQIRFAPGQLIVKLKKGKTLKDLKTLNAKYYLADSKRFSKDGPNHNVYILKTTRNADIVKMAAAYSSSSAVEYAEPNYLGVAMWTPNDPYYSSAGTWGQQYGDMWGLRRMNAASAWDNSKGNGIIVAVIDSGIDYNHPEISGNIYRNGEGNIIGADFVDIDVDAYLATGLYGLDPQEDYTDTELYTDIDFDLSDKSGHGTHISGIIAAVGNNGAGVIGLAPEAKIMPVRAGFRLFYSEEKNWWPSFEADDVAKAIKFARDNNAKVINISTGFADEPQIVKDEIQAAYEQGCVIVAAAGNKGGYIEDLYPGSDLRVIPVIAADPQDKIAYFSHIARDNYNVVSAPGVDILSLRAAGTDIYAGGVNEGVYIVNEQYFRATGSSMSAAFVSGLSALILSRHPDWTPHQVREALILSCEDILNPTIFGFTLVGPDHLSGYGMINASKALQIDSIPEYQLEITYPRQADTIQGIVRIRGTANSTNFFRYYVEILKADDPLLGWQIVEIGTHPVVDGVLAELNTLVIADGYIFLRLSVTDGANNLTRYMGDIKINGGQAEYTAPFIDGIFVGNALDTTPPLQPTIQVSIVGGHFQVEVSAEDPESGISECRIAVGSAENSTDIFPWSGVDNKTPTILETFQVRTAKPYYFTSRAKNGAGLWSELGSSGRILCFIRGDANSDDAIDIGDVVTILWYLFGDGLVNSVEAADLDADGQVQLNDAIYILNYIFAGGPAPAPPFPEPGIVK